MLRQLRLLGMLGLAALAAQNARGQSSLCEKEASPGICYTERQDYARGVWALGRELNELLSQPEPGRAQEIARKYIWLGLAYAHWKDDAASAATPHLALADAAFQEALRHDPHAAADGTYLGSATAATPDDDTLFHQAKKHHEALVKQQSLGKESQKYTSRGWYARCGGSFTTFRDQAGINAFFSYGPHWRLWHVGLWVGTGSAFSEYGGGVSGGLALGVHPFAASSTFAARAVGFTALIGYRARTGGDKADGVFAGVGLDITIRR